MFFEKSNEKNNSLKLQNRAVHLLLERKVILHRITNDDYNRTSWTSPTVSKKKKKKVMTKKFKEMQQRQLSLKTLSKRLFCVCKA